MNQRVCKVFELTEFEKEKVNEIINLSFATDLSQDRLSFSSELFMKQVDIMTDLTLYLMNANGEEIQIKWP